MTTMEPNTSASRILFSNSLLLNCVLRKAFGEGEHCNTLIRPRAVGSDSGVGLRALRQRSFVSFDGVNKLCGFFGDVKRSSGSRELCVKKEIRELSALSPTELVVPALGPLNIDSGWLFMYRNISELLIWSSLSSERENEISDVSSTLAIFLSSEGSSSTKSAFAPGWEF